MDNKEPNFAYAIQTLNIEKYRLLAFLKKAYQEETEIEGILLYQNQIAEIDLAIQKLTPAVVLPSHAKMHKITEAVCSVTGADINKVRTKSRKANVVNTRRISVHFILLYINCTLYQAGEYFGMDHSNISHMREKVKELLKCDPDTCSIISQVQPLIDELKKKGDL